MVFAGVGRLEVYSGRRQVKQDQPRRSRRSRKKAKVRMPGSHRLGGRIAIRPSHAPSACRHLSCGEGAVCCSLATESIEPKPAPSIFFVLSVSFVVKVFLEFPPRCRVDAMGHPPRAACATTEKKTPICHEACPPRNHMTIASPWSIILTVTTSQKTQACCASSAHASLKRERRGR